MLLSILSLVRLGTWLNDVLPRECSYELRQVLNAPPIPGSRDYMVAMREALDKEELEGNYGEE